MNGQVVPLVHPLPTPVVDVEWGCGPGAVGVVIRPGSGRFRTARVGHFETSVSWTDRMELEEGDGDLTSMVVLEGDAPTVEAAALRGLAKLSAIDRWSPDLRDFVLAEARRA